MITGELNEQFNVLSVKEDQQKQIANDSSSLSSDEDDDELLHNIRQKVLKMEAEEDDDDPKTLPKTKNEKNQLEGYLNKNETKQERETRLNYTFENRNKTQPIYIGVIQNILPQQIIVQSRNNDFVVNLDQLLIHENQELLGSVEDVFGRVETPFYAINQDLYIKELINSGHIKIGDKVYIGEKINKCLGAIEIQQLIKRKGCDASNQFDEEVPEEDMEYSDDELEQNSKFLHRKKSFQQGKEKQQDLFNKNQQLQQTPKETQQPQINQYKNEFCRVGAQYFNLMPNGIPDLLAPLNQQQQG